MKRTTCCLLLFAVLTFLLCGCGSSAKVDRKVPDPAPAELASVPVPTPVPDILSGVWTVTGVKSHGMVIAVSDVPALESMYEFLTLTVDSDGGFQIFDLISSEGHWEETPSVEHAHAYRFTTEKYIRIRFGDSGEPQEEEGAADGVVQTGYLADGDENTLLINEGDDYLLILSRKGANSTYLEENRAHVSTGTPSGSGASSSAAQTPTSGERNALASAKQYLNVTAFSRSGLIEQLEYEGYTHSEAVYAVDTCGADWNEQAVRSAKQYLEISAFSRSGLIEQLEYEGFTHAQAVYGVDKAY